VCPQKNTAEFESEKSRNLMGLLILATVKFTIIALFRKKKAIC